MKTHNTAARILATIFGVLSGLGAMLHGIGEVQQGNIAPKEVVFSSWTKGPIAEYFDGDPAMTLLNDIQTTGIITILISLIAIVWSLFFIKKKFGGLILILISIAMLLFGGGFGPPTLGILAGISGTGIHASHTWWKKIIPMSFQKILTKVWPVVFIICLLNGLFLIIGHVVAAYFFAPVNGTLFLNSFFLAVILLVLSTFTGIFYDLKKT